MDDNSPDGTAAIVEEIARQKISLHILKRERKMGGATAFLQGFSWGINNGFDILLAMDADFSHDPKYIPAMLKEIETADLVIGSRNVPGGMIENRSFIRNILTKGGAFYCQCLLKCPIKDFTGGFNMWRKTTLEKIGLEDVVSRGYIYPFTQRETASKYFFQGPAFDHIPGSREEFLSDILTGKPAIITLFREEDQIMVSWHQPVFEMIEEEYRLLSDENGFNLYIRNNYLQQRGNL